MKKIFLLISLITSITLSAQDFGGAKVGVGNFVRRMYNTQPFDGVKLFQTQDGVDYMVCLVALKKDPSKSESIQSRIASVKAKAFASQYVNGSNISSEVIVITTEQKTKDSIITKTHLQETLKESSMGFAEGMELLLNFDSNDGKQNVYIYYREIKNK